MNHLSSSLLVAAFSLWVAGSADASVSNAAWREKRQSNIAASLAEPSPENLEVLFQTISSLGRKREILDPEEISLWSDAKAAMLSIPEGLPYLERRIAELTKAEMDGTKPPSSRERSWYFETLIYLQSPEVIRFVGGSLFEEENPFAHYSEEDRWFPNSALALQTLANMELKDFPVKGEYPDVQKDLRTAQLWYQQVRAGTRTFSFEGDDRVYTLAGPVSGEGISGKGASQTSETPAALVASAVQPAITPKWPIFVGLAAVGGACFIAFRKQKASVPR